MKMQNLMNLMEMQKFLYMDTDSVIVGLNA